MEGKCPHQKIYGGECPAMPKIAEGNNYPVARNLP